MLKIQILKRHYNGDYGVGSIFTEKYIFEIENNLCLANGIKTFCCNEDFGSNILSNVDITIPFVLSENNFTKLNNVVDEIKTNNYIYNESHYKKDGFDFNRYNYIDVIINDTNYELSVQTNSNIINELNEILLIQKIESILDNSISSINSLEANFNE